MLGLDQGETLQALSYIVIALFVGGRFLSGRRRQQMKWAAIGLYGVALALALVSVGVWLFGIRG